jgi:hypothetical protein
MWLRLKAQANIKYFHFDKSDLLMLRAGFITFLYLWKQGVVQMKDSEVKCLEMSFNKGRTHKLSRHSTKPESFGEFEHFENWMSYYFLREEYSAKDVLEMGAVFNIMLKYSLEMYTLYEVFPVGKIVNSWYEEPAKDSLFVFIRVLYSLSCAAFVARKYNSAIEVVGCLK